MAGAGTQAFWSETEINSFEPLQSSDIDVNAAKALLCNPFKSNKKSGSTSWRRLKPGLR